MELRLLSIGEACTLGPDPADEVRRALKQLAKDSGELLPRAVLIHDNGQDFIQFYATEPADPEKPAGETPCHIQWCRQSGSRSEPEHLSCDQVDYEQVIELFEWYAQKKEDWDTGVSWVPYKEKGKVGATVSNMGCGCTFILAGIAVVMGPDFGVTERIGGLIAFGLGVFYLWGVFSPGTSYGKAWASSSAGGASCSGGCQGGCGGSGGGGGGGGGDGGCGGGGE